MIYICEISFSKCFSSKLEKKSCFPNTQTDKWNYRESSLLKKEDSKLNLLTVTSSLKLFILVTSGFYLKNICLVAKLLYNYKYLLKRFGGNLSFFDPIHDKCLNFFVKIRVTNKNLFFIYFARSSVCYSFASYDSTDPSLFMHCLPIFSTIKSNFGFTIHH